MAGRMDSLREPLEDGHLKFSGLTPSARVYGLGLVLLVALTICSRHFSARGAPAFLIPLSIAGIAYLFAIREFFSTPKFPKRVVLIGLALAAVWQFSFLLQAPGPDDDIHRYVWDGRLQRLGHNPYTAIPADPALSALHTPETRTLNNPNLASPYPPGAELFFRAVTAVHESVFAMKVAFVLCAWAIILLLFDILHRSGEAPHWVLAFAWHPLLAVEVAGSGHIDIVGALLLMLSAAALARGRKAIAALAFGLAVSVKFLPIVLLPLYWKRIRARDLGLAAIVFAALYIPFLQNGRVPTGSLGTFIQHFRFNDPIFALLERVARPQVIAAFAVLLGFLVAISLRPKSDDPSSQPFAWPMAASLLCAPVVYPWYLLWTLPFLRSISTLPIIIWTVSIIPTYYVWHLREMGRPWIVPAWALLLEYGCVVLASGVLAYRRCGRKKTFPVPQ
jgi:alpha-1,6-mannosyltransferase